MEDDITGASLGRAESEGVDLSVRVERRVRSSASKAALRISNSWAEYS